MAQGFNIPGGMGNMAQIMKQAQKMSEDMKQKQADLEAKEWNAVSAGGAVKVTLTGKSEIKDLVIDKDMVDPDDVEMLQDSIMAAVNEALRMKEKEQEEFLGGALGGMKLPF